MPMLQVCAADLPPRQVLIFIWGLFFNVLARNKLGLGTTPPPGTHGLSGSCTAVN